MQDSESYLSTVPWTTRDVWLGVVFLVLWQALLLATAIFFGLGGLQVNPGVLTGIAESALLVPVWWLTVRKYRIQWSALGLRSFSSGMVGLGCGLMILSFMFNAVYGFILAFFDLQVQIDLAPIFADLSSPWWLLLAGVVIAPIVEEVFFRGFVFGGLRKRYNWQRAAVISSALFAVIHLQLTAVVPIFLLGYIFAYLSYRSNSIVPAILMHVLTNGMALGTAYLLANTTAST